MTINNHHDIPNHDKMGLRPSGTILSFLSLVIIIIIPIASRSYYHFIIPVIYPNIPVIYYNIYMHIITYHNIHIITFLLYIMTSSSYYHFIIPATSYNNNNTHNNNNNNNKMGYCPSGTILSFLSLVIIIIIPITSLSYHYFIIPAIS